MTLNISCRCLSEVRQFLRIFQCFENKRQQNLEIKLFSTREICHTNSDKYLKIHISIQNIYITDSVSHGLSLLI